MKLKKQTLVNNRFYAQTIQNIISGKKSFKDKKYFVHLLDERILKLDNFDLKKYNQTNLLVKESSDTLSLAYKKNYSELLTQIKAQLLVFEYLKNNMLEYRTGSFILDDFDLSLNFAIDVINSIPGISYITEVMYYYTRVTMGEIIVTFILIGFFHIFK